MANENELLEISDEDLEIQDYAFDKIEEELNQELIDSLKELSFLEKEKETIKDPDNLGKVILNEVWDQFGKQIGLDMTNETLIQKYEREHPEPYSKAVGDEIMQDERYKKANAAMKQEQQDGTLVDGYTGKKLGASDKANLDHVVPRKELHDNDRRKQAGIDTKDLANKEENLVPTNESLNKSKKEKSNKEYVKNREQREADLKKNAAKEHEKIDNSNMSDADKKIAHEKIDKRLQDKLDADDELMMKADKTARKAINKDIAKGVVKETAKKAGKDALKAVAVQALFSMLKEIMNALVRFFKSASKTFKNFLEEMKEAVKRFFSKIFDYLKTGATVVIGTIISEIFGPIVSVFKKLASFIKIGVSSFWDAIKTVNSDEYKDKPLSIKIATVGKVIMGGLTAAGAIGLGEAITVLLGIYVPVLHETKIPLIGALDELIGMFLGSVVSGIVGAIVINFLDRFIANEKRNDIIDKQIDASNEALKTQREILTVNEIKTEQGIKNNVLKISKRHSEAADMVREMLKEGYEEEENEEYYGITQDEFDNLDALIDGLNE